MGRIEKIAFNPNSEAETANLRSSPLIPRTLGGRRPEVFCSDVVAASLCHQRGLAQISGSKSFSGFKTRYCISRKNRFPGGGVMVTLSFVPLVVEMV
jgi:hypothetical protein